MTTNAKDTERIKNCEFKHRSNESLPYHAESKQLKDEVENLSRYSATERM